MHSIRDTVCSFDGTAFFFNHACKSKNVNAYVKQNSEKIEKFPLQFHAKKNIKKGQQIFISYGKEYFKQFDKPIENCFCCESNQ